MWVWGGVGESNSYFQRSSVHAYDPVANEWAQYKAQAATTDDIPPASKASRCAVLGTDIYSFGRRNEETGYLNDLYAMDTTTITWRKVDVKDKKPAPRDDCGLCSTEES
jgi:N-acetylneuraminic acid mutarotase